MAESAILSGPRAPLRDLSLIFIAWKFLIGLVVVLSPGIGYDTSSDLLASQSLQSLTVQSVPIRISHTILKFVRWDAIYYTEIARNGHVFEQEWAFGKGLSTVLIAVVNSLGLKSSNGLTQYAIAGIVVSHISHWLSTILVFLIAGMLQDPVKLRSSSVPFVAAVLYIISPAGVFLSAPYSESLFALLNMLGFFLYVKSKQKPENEAVATGLLLRLLSGVSFGFAATVRGNGILSGVPFFLDAIEGLGRILNPGADGFEKSQLVLHLQFTVLSGCAVAAGAIYPQIIAYNDYCVSRLDRRPWCSAMLPSIFSFVQSHYWNVGFLRYWTLSNAPLFLLAAPCLYLLILSGLQVCHPALSPSSTAAQRLHLRVALPQLILAVLALTNYHVQIITRLSSGYPIWYIWMATKINDWTHSDTMIRTLTMYALVQAGLFACFLPPA